MKSNTISEMERIYGGLSGIDLDFQEFEFSNGIVLKKIYAHLFAPYMMAFSPAPQGEHHPGPWKAARGGVETDITAEIVIPDQMLTHETIKTFELLIDCNSLFRLFISPMITLSIISNVSMADAANAPDNATNIVPMETIPRGTTMTLEDRGKITVSRMKWLGDHWANAHALLNASKEFAFGVRVLSSVQFVQDRSLALISLWAPLEGLFSPHRSELTFRISALIASFLEEPGERRLALKSKITKLYGVRSKAVHGNPDYDTGVFTDTCNLLKTVLGKMIDTNRIPTKLDLDKMLFGAVKCP